MSSRPVRAAQGRDHRLVGRDGRRPHLRPRAVRPAAAPVDDGGDCATAGCRRRRRPAPDPQGLRVPRRRHGGGGPRAGTQVAQVAIARGAGRGQLAHGRGAAGRAPAAPRRRQRRHRGTARRAAETRSSTRARPDQTEYLQVVQNWGAQAGARTNHLCLDLYDLPQIPHRDRGGAGRRGALRHPRGRVPVLPARPRRGRAARTAWSTRTTTRVAFAPYARARRSRSGSCRAATTRTSPGPRDRDIAATAEALRQVLGRLAASLDGPPYNLVLHTAPLQRAGRRDLPLALGDPPAAARDRGPGARDRAAGQPGLARGRGRGAARDGGATGRRSPAAMTVAAGGGRRTMRRPSSHAAGARRLADRHTAPNPSRSASGGHVARSDSAAISSSRLSPGRALAVSAGWDRDAGATRSSRSCSPSTTRDLRVSAADAPRPRAGRGPHPGRVRQGVPGLRHARGPANARAWLYQIAHRVALDELRRRKIVRFLPVDRRVARLGAVGRAPRDGGPAVRRAPARARAGSPSASAPRSSSPSSTTSPASSSRRRSASRTWPPARS